MVLYYEVDLTNQQGEEVRPSAKVKLDWSAMINNIRKQIFDNMTGRNDA